MAPLLPFNIQGLPGMEAAGAGAAAAADPGTRMRHRLEANLVLRQLWHVSSQSVT